MATSEDTNLAIDMNRVLRSTRVPIAEESRPRIRSPSQCPGTARSSASAGRCEIITSAVTNCFPRCLVRARAFCGGLARDIPKNWVWKRVRTGVRGGGQASAGADKSPYPFPYPFLHPYAGFSLRLPSSTLSR